LEADDDDEYMNENMKTHSAFVMTVSAAGMYWLLRHAQHARDINIHKLHPLPKKSAWAALPIFCTVGPVTYRIAVFVLWLIFRRFQSAYFQYEQWKHSVAISVTKIGIVARRLHWKSRVCSMQISITISITIFCIVEHSWVIWSTSVTTESKGSFHSGFPFFGGGLS